MRFLILLSVLLAVTFAAPAVWKDCTKPGAIGKVSDLVITPNPPAPNSALNITGTGALLQDITGGQFTCVIKTGGLTVVNQKGDICKDTTINLPLGLGFINAKALSCPAKAGPITLVQLGQLKGTFPGAYEVNFSAKSTDGKELLCVDITWTQA
jgi:hypothetical protein